MTAFIGGKLLLLLPFASSFTLLPQFYHHVSLMTLLFEPSPPIWSTYQLNSKLPTGNQLMTDLFVYRPPRSPWLQLPSYTFFLSSLSSWNPRLQELCEHITTHQSFSNENLVYQSNPDFDRYIFPGQQLMWAQSTARDQTSQAEPFPEISPSSIGRKEVRSFGVDLKRWWLHQSSFLTTITIISQGDPESQWPTKCWSVLLPWPGISITSLFLKLDQCLADWPRSDFRTSSQVMCVATPTGPTAPTMELKGKVGDCDSHRR